MRKIIQLGKDSCDDLVALCDDGSLWYFGETSNDWHRMKDIPQDDAQEQESSE